MARVVRMFVVCVALAALAAAQSCPKVSYGSPQTLNSPATSDFPYFAATASQSVWYLAIHQPPVSHPAGANFYIFKLVDDRWSALQTINVKDAKRGGRVGISERYLAMEARLGAPPPNTNGSTVQLHYRANNTFDFVLRTQIDTPTGYYVPAFTVASNVLAVARAESYFFSNGVDVYRLSPTSISKTQSITTIKTSSQNVVVTQFCLFITLQNSAVSVYRRSSESTNFRAVQTIEYASLPVDVRGGSTGLFGLSMDAAYNGATLAVGCTDCGPRGKPHSVVYVYAAVNNAYAFRTALFRSEGPSYAGFAHSLSVSSRQVSVGAFNAESGGLPLAGAVYTFTRCSGGGFSQSGVLHGSHRGERFGLVVLTRGNQVIAPAYNRSGQLYHVTSTPFHIGTN